MNTITAGRIICLLFGFYERIWVNWKMAKQKPLKTQGFQGFYVVREAGLEVAVPDFINFLVLNYVTNSSESGVLCTSQSIVFILCDSVKGQKWGQIHNQYTAVFSNKFFLSFQSGISMVRNV